MRYLKILIIGLLLTLPVLATADVEDLPGSAVWYFHIDLEQMREDGPGRASIRGSRTRHFPISGKRPAWIWTVNWIA